MNIVVAGASRGIGFALATGLQHAGASVTGFGRSPVAAIQASFSYRACDLGVADKVAALFDSVQDKNQSIDAYFHVAGTTSPAKDGLQSADAFAQTVGDNLVKGYSCCAEAGRRMALAGGGSIVVVTSIGSVLGFPKNPGYVAAKGGLRMMAKALALDLGHAKVRVNCLVPGYIRTEMTAASYADPTLNAQRAERTMLGRWGEVDDLVGASVFLASNASTYVTGTDLFVDGGWTGKGL
jgi:NAD(P)-dependent dehydrogenase (short-subunit alcohol dehydrogenase family)